MPNPLGMHRREFITMAGLASLALTFQADALSTATATATATATDGPILWLVERQRAKVYLFGFGEAKDRSWLTPKIQRAFDESDEIWFETPSEAAVVPDEEKKRQQAEQARLTDELGHDNTRTLFDTLGPRLGERTLKTANELSVPKERIEHLRPWLAYFILNSAFLRSAHLQVSDFPDQVLGVRAAAAKKVIHSELPTPVDTTRWFATLSDEAQREHVEDLLDFIDDYKAGRQKDDYAWIGGHTDTRSIDRMRRKRPAMYPAFQAVRNRQWADRIVGFLATDKTYFIAIGMNHILGPDSIPRCLNRIGVKAKQI